MDRTTADPPMHDAGRARLLPSLGQTGGFGSAGASPYRVKMKMPGHRPSFLLTSAATECPVPQLAVKKWRLICRPLR